MKKTLALFLGSIATSAFCQHYELGVGLNAYSALRDNSVTYETGGYSKNKITYSSNPVLTFNYVNSKNTDFFIHTGYFYEPSKLDDKSGNGSSTTYSSGSSLAKSVFLRAGIGKRYNYEKLYFISAVNIPFEYIFYNYSNTSYSQYDYYTGNTYSSYYSDKASPAFNIGLSLQQSFYYRICKSFMAGMDLNMTLNYNVMNGKETQSQGSFTNNGNLYDVVDHTIKYKFQTVTALYLRPVVSVKYILPSKKTNAPQLKS